MNSSIWAKMQAIDPRVLYVVLILCIVIPLIFGVTINGEVSQPTQQAYDTLEQIAQSKPNSPILISADWSASTRGESHWQTIAVLRQIMRHHIKFALVSFDPRNPALMRSDITTVSNELVADHELPVPYLYGDDYCFWGYKPTGATPQVLKGIVQDVPGTIKVDYRGVPFASLKCMNGVQSASDFSAIILITPSSALDQWLQFVVKDGQPPLIYFPTAVMAPEGYPYLQSHQIAGMVTGIKGAGDLEQLENTKGFARRISTALSLVYFLILMLILIGNIGYFVERSQKSREAKL